MTGLLITSALLLALPFAALADSSRADAGGTHSCALNAAGGLACWGGDSAGQLDGLPAGEFVSVTAGGAHSCAIRVDGGLACWGDNSAGQLDDIPGGDFSSVSAGGAHTCAIREDGSLACWGDDSEGQLDGVPEGSFAAVSAGGAHTCAIRANGELECWGDDSEGQVSEVDDAFQLHRHNNDRHHPHDKDEEPSFLAVSAGGAHTCAIDSGEDLFCWGGGSAGQLAGIPEGEFSSLSSGAAHSCAVRADGSLACWGSNAAGQLDGVPNGEFASVSAGGSHSCAVRADGSIACWGENSDGRVQPSILAADPPRAVIGQPYEFAFQTTPQAPGATFLLASGTLPQGLALGADGGLAGTPTEAGDHAFGIAASNGLTPDAELLATVSVVGAPVLDLDPAADVTTVTAALSGSIDPSNLAAEAWFEYWPTGGSPEDAASTPVQSIAAGLEAVPLAADLTGLAPDVDYSFRLAATNELSTEPVRTAALTFQTAAVPQPVLAKVEGLPPPVAGQTINVVPQNGVVRTRCPEDEGFAKLLTPEQISIECVIDTRRGAVDMTTATGEGATQSGVFWGGMFGVGQEEASGWQAELSLTGPQRCEKRKSARRKNRASASARRGGGRKLWGSGRGNFRTKGNYGSASVRGTIWLVADRCNNSTAFAVREGTVVVRDFVKKKSVTLQVGQRYVAKGPFPLIR